MESSNNINYMGKKMIRAKEVVSTYGIGLSTVWYYVNKGYFNSYKPSNGITLFKVEELDKFFGYSA